MLKLIQEAQEHHMAVNVIVEKCQELNVSPILLEDLGGTLLAYVQKIKAGGNLGMDKVSNLANVLGFAELLSAIKSSKNVRPGVASSLINVYKGVKPGDDSGAYNSIMQVVDGLPPRAGEVFRQFASKWGRELQAQIQSPNQQARMDIANRLVQAAHRVRSAIELLQSTHGASMQKQAVQNGILGRQLGMSGA